MPATAARPPWGLIFLLVLMTPAAVAVSFCFGFIPALHQVAMMIMSLRGRSVAGTFHSRGVLLSALSHFMLIWLFAASASLFSETHLGYLAAATVGATLHAIALAPFAFFVPAHLDVHSLPRKSPETPHPMPSIETALAQWEAIGLRERVTIVVFRVVPALAAIAVFMFAKGWLSRSLTFFIASWTYGLGVYAYSDRVTATYLRTRGVERDALPSRRHLRTLTGVALGLLLTVSAYGIVAVTEPTPMRSCEQPELPVEEIAVERSWAERVQVPGTDVELALGREGVVVATADGGGAGDVSFFSPFEDENLDALPPASLLVSVGSDEGFDVYMEVADLWAVFSIDGTGVRTDDGVAARVQHGLGTPALVVFLLGFLTMALSVWLLGAGVRAARRLRSIRDAEELVSSETIGAMDGTVHGDSLGVRRGKVVGAGEVRVQLGGRLLRLRLPEGGVACVGDGVLDGQQVTLVGRFAQLLPGHREGTLPWPEDAQLLLAERSLLADGLLQRATRPARILALASVLIALASLMMVWLHRM